MKRPLPVLLFIAFVLALGAAACGAAKQAVPPPSSSTGSTSQTASTTTASSSTTASPGSGAGASTAPAPPSGGPVPRGFVPVSFTAISSSQFWLLGTAPCSNPVCTSLVRTTDGGAHFVGLPAPSAPLQGVGVNGGLSDLRFANPRDGFAGADGYPAPLWETHDGGEHWRTGPANVITFTVSGDRVYALTGSCSNGTCSHLGLISSSAHTDAWSAVALPLHDSDGFPTMTAHGSSVWISLSPGSLGGAPHQTLVYSSDGGVTVAKMASPCVPGLGGRLEAASAQVVWAVCPTGMLAGAWRSTDAGAHWSVLSGGRLPLSNGARIAPMSDTSAVIATGDQGELVRTTDGGQTFTTILKPGSIFQTLFWFGFTDPQTGSALIQGPGAFVGPSKIPPFQLWRSGDGGVSWHGPVRIG